MSLLRVSPLKNGGLTHRYTSIRMTPEHQGPDPGQEHAADLPVGRERQGPVAAAVGVVPVLVGALDEEVRSG